MTHIALSKNRILLEEFKKSGDTDIAEHLMESIWLLQYWPGYVQNGYSCCMWNWWAYVTRYSNNKCVYCWHPTIINIDDVIFAAHSHSLLLALMTRYTVSVCPMCYLCTVLIRQHLDVASMLSSLIPVPNRSLKWSTLIRMNSVRIIFYMSIFISLSAPDCENTEWLE